MRDERALSLDAEQKPLIDKAVDGVAYGELRGAVLLGEIRFRGNRRPRCKGTAVDLAADSSANTQVQRKMRRFSVFVEPWCAAVALRHAGTSFRTRRLQSIVNTVLHDMPKSSGT